MQVLVRKPICEVRNTYQKQYFHNGPGRKFAFDLETRDVECQC